MWLFWEINVILKIIQIYTIFFINPIASWDIVEAIFIDNPIISNNQFLFKIISSIARNCRYELFVKEIDFAKARFMETFKY